LRAFYPYRRLLSREKRTGALLKTGTLKDVYSLAGYLEKEQPLEKWQPLYFVILLNQKKNHRDRILRLLEEEYR
jgi:D-alanyl-D-alanine carboxypeptidase